MVYANGVTMKVTLETIADNGETKYTVIYQGSASSELLALIKNARTIFFGNIEKSVVLEGSYSIEFFDGKEEKKYSIKNNYWIYDEYKEKFLRCSILSNLRGYLINYIFNTGFSLYLPPNPVLPEN